MAKAKSKTRKPKANHVGWYDHNRPKLRDKTVQFLVADAAREFGGESSVMVAGSADNLLIGLPMPSIALEWILVNSVFPLSLLIQVVGLPGTCKSALIYEFLWWFQQHGGAGTLIENEDKISMTLLNSIFQYAATGLIFDKSHSLEDWQRKAYYWEKRFRESMDGTKAAPGPGRIFPVGIAVDSLMSKSAMEVQDKGDKEGSFGRNYPIEAGSIKTFMQSFPQKLTSMPMSLLCTNHLKPKRNEHTGHDDDHAPGGFAVEFQDALIIKTSRWKKSIRTSAFNGRGITLTCIKNSLGEGDRHIDTRLLWWNEVYMDPEMQKERRRQQTSWDWGWTTIKFLTGLVGESKERVREVIDLTPVQTGDATCNLWSKTLDIKKEKPISWARAGERIQQNPEMLVKLRDALDIHIGHVFDPAVDYRIQRNRLRRVLP